MTARVAGLVYILSVIIVVVSQFAVSGPLFVTGHPDATARNILAHETRFRISIVMDMFYGGSVIVVLTAFYVILKSFGETLALLAAACRMVMAMLWIIVARNQLTVVRLLHREPANPLSRTLLSGWEGYYTGLLFWSVAATICAYLWLRSRYVPRALAVFGIAASAWALFCTAVYLIVPTFSGIVNLWWFDTPLTLFELGVSIVLLVRGAVIPSAKPRGIASYETAGAR